MTDKPQPKPRKRLLGPRLRYALFLVVIVALMLVGINAFLAVKFHREFVDRDQGWPGLRRHATIGYENTPGYEAQWDTYYYLCHDLGYRLSKGQSTTEVTPGGILAIGGSFTFGDAVENEQAFPRVAADSLGLSVYNYGVGSYSYASVLLQLRDLDERGVLDRLQPSVVLLGAGDWLVDRSLSPLFPTEGLPFGYAYIGREGDGLAVKPPPSFYSIDNFWDLAERYYPEGTDYTDARFSLSRFYAMFSHAPRVLAAQAAGKGRFKPGHSDIGSSELYAFVIDEIAAVAERYDARVVVLWMPLFHLALDPGLRQNIADDQLLVDGGIAIRTAGIEGVEYFNRHPSASAHAVYGEAIAQAIRDNPWPVAEVSAPPADVLP